MKHTHIQREREKERAEVETQVNRKRKDNALPCTEHAFIAYIKYRRNGTATEVFLPSLQLYSVRSRDNIQHCVSLRLGWRKWTIHTNTPARMIRMRIINRHKGHTALQPVKPNKTPQMCVCTIVNSWTKQTILFDLSLYTIRRWILFSFFLSFSSFIHISMGRDCNALQLQIIVSSTTLQLQ